MTDPNDRAFPFDYVQPEKAWGLTKREYFAGLAMQGLLSHPENIKAMDRWQGINEGLKGVENDGVAAISVQFSDALIAELNKENGSPTGDTVSDSSDREAR